MDIWVKYSHLVFVIVSHPFVGVNIYSTCISHDATSSLDTYVSPIPLKGKIFDGVAESAWRSGFLFASGAQGTDLNGVGSLEMFGLSTGSPGPGPWTRDRLRCLKPCQHNSEL